MYGLLKTLINPYALLMIPLGLVLFAAWWRKAEPRRTLRGALLLWAGLYLLSVPPLANRAARTLEGQYPMLSSLPEDADAIIVLGGGVRPPSDLRPRPSLPDTVRERLLHALELHRMRPSARLILCGGSAPGFGSLPAEAEVMRDFCTSLGIDPETMLLESKSRDTFENLLFAKELMAEHGLGRAVLVTDARHMPRAVRCARKLGVPIVPGSCDPRGDGLIGPWYAWLLPNPDALRLNHLIFHEYVGIASYRLRGRF